MTPIRWRPILFIALTWAFIVNGPAACTLLFSHPCDGLHPARCE